MRQKVVLWRMVCQSLGRGRDDFATVGCEVASWREGFSNRKALPALFWMWSPGLPVACCRLLLVRKWIAAC